MKTSALLQNAEINVSPTLSDTETMQTEGFDTDSYSGLDNGTVGGATALDSTIALSDLGSLKRKEPTNMDESEGEHRSKSEAKHALEDSENLWTKPRTGISWIEHSRFVKKRREDRLKGITPLNLGRPRDFLTRAIRANESNNPEYVRKLRALPAAPPTPEQLAKLNKSANSVPNYLGRTASLASGYRFATFKRCTNGYTTQTVMMPAADTHEDECMHARLQDMSQGETLFMTGQHLIWNDVRYDEFLSYSKDPLFLVVHALRRYHQGQGQVTIQFLDRRKARNTKGEPAMFYQALELYETFGIPAWSGWSQPNRGDLKARKFTQEYLSHGTIIVDDTRFEQASIEDLIRDGLYEIFPDFKVPDNHQRTGLYTGQVYFRTVGYPTVDKRERVPNRRIYSYSRCSRSKPFTTEFLEQVQKLTRNFGTTSSELGTDDSDDKNGEPYLYIFLAFLTFEKRLKQDPVFIEWIKTHYTGEDVRDIYDDGIGGVLPNFTQVAENLPGVIQLIDLIRDAGFAFGIMDLEETKVETRNTLTNEVYAEDDARLQGDATSFYKYSQEMQIQERVKHRKSKIQKKAKHTSPKESHSRNLAQAGDQEADTPTLTFDDDEDLDQPAEYRESESIAGLLDHGENEEFLEDYLQGDKFLEQEEEDLVVT